MKRIVGFDDYYVDKKGRVYKLFQSRNKKVEKRKTEWKEVSISKTSIGTLRVNLNSKTYQVHDLVYKTYVDENFNGTLVFLDGNKLNCSLDNLISLDDLRDFYIKNHNTKK